jgi:ABC-type nitrate/sulfonate/bicarbonate transport system substrate-binding protein
MISRILFAALLAASALQQPQKITINFPTRSGASWPLFIAKEGGYYQKYGLDVNLVFAGHPAGVAMIVSGEAQMASYSLESAMQAAANDSSLVMVGNSLNKAVFALVARKEIKTVKELKGKRVAVSQIGDPPYNYGNALLRKFGMSSRDVQWVPVGTDVNGRVVALEGGRVDATLLTAPAYFKLETAGFNTLANIADYDDIFASTIYLMKRNSIAANPKLPELLIKAHAEAIKRFYDDKQFAIKAYMAYDKQSPADVERIYDHYAKVNTYERVPYVLAPAVQYILDNLSDPQTAKAMRAFNYRTVIDNSYLDRIVKEGFFEKLYGPGIKTEIDRKTKLAYR